MRRKKLPHIVRLIRLALKCAWYALTLPNNPFYEREVNFWNIPVRKRKTEQEKLSSRQGFTPQAQH